MFSDISLLLLSCLFTFKINNIIIIICHCGIDTATFGIAVWCKMKQRTQKQSYDIDDTACWSRSSSSGTHLTRRIWSTPYVVLGGAHSGTNSTYLLWVVNGWRTDCTTHEVHGPRAGQRTNQRACYNCSSIAIKQNLIRNTHLAQSQIRGTQL